MKELTIEEKLIYRNIKRAAIVWLLLLRLDPQPVTEASAAQILAIDRATARRYLLNLNEVGICTRLGRYKGYILTDSGRQLALPIELRSLSARGENTPSPLVNNDEGLKDIKTNESLLLINVEDEILPFEGEKSPLDPEPIDQLISKIIEASPEKEEILNALLGVGISINRRTINLLLSDELTAYEIKSQQKALESRGFGDQTGILIVNLESRYRAKGADIDPNTGHKSSCDCSKCISSRVSKYADWNQDDESNE